jgi:hypothetical protein
MSEELDLSKEFDLSKEPEGLLVRSNDGQSLFIPNSDIKRFAVKSDSIEKFWSHRSNTGVAQAEGLSPYCRMLSGWLLTHDPDSETWRKVSVKWMNYC